MVLLDALHLWGHIRGLWLSSVHTCISLIEVSQESWPGGHGQCNQLQAGDVRERITCSLSLSHAALQEAMPAWGEGRLEHAGDSQKDL